MEEVGVGEGSLILATLGGESTELSLACVYGLASEIWAGERATVSDGPRARPPGRSRP